MTRSLARALLAPALVLFATGSGQAQEVSAIAWTGCWEGAAEVGDEASVQTFMVCFSPAAEAGVAEISTYDDGALVALEEMRADGVARPVEEGGCTGTRIAESSSEGTRVYVRSEMSCEGGAQRTTTGVLSLLPEAEGWVEIQAVSVDGSEPLLGIRTFVPAYPSMVADAGISNPAAGRELAVQSARTRASAPLTPAGLVEVVERAGPEVASALLVERGERLGVDADILTALVAGGVPAEVVDVLVALAYPERFVIGGTGQAPEPEAREPAQLADSRARGRGRVSTNVYGYTPWRFGNDLFLDPYWAYGFGRGYRSYDYRYDSYSPYGGVYGYGPRFPRVIVVGPPVAQERDARLGRDGVVRGGGGSDDGGSSASRQPSRSNGDQPRGSRPSRISPSGSSGGSSASPSSGSSGSDGSDGDRRAVPR